MDPFELLALPKKPLLSEEEIGIAYRRLAATMHPDQAGGDEKGFKELGEAEAILRDQSRRLRALIDNTHASTIPPEAAELFPHVATLTHEADDLLARHAAATNPLARAVLAAPLKKLATELDVLLSTIGNWHSDLNALLAAIDAAWPAHDPEAIAALADSFSYATRWESQLKEHKLTLDCL